MVNILLERKIQNNQIDMQRCGLEADIDGCVECGRFSYCRHVISNALDLDVLAGLLADPEPPIYGF